MWLVSYINFNLLKDLKFGFDSYSLIGMHVIVFYTNLPCISDYYTLTVPIFNHIYYNVNML